LAPCLDAPAFQGQGEMRDSEQAAKHYRQRAEEIRTIADSMTQDKERLMLLQIAGEYERWATAAEAKARSRL